MAEYYDEQSTYCMTCGACCYAVPSPPHATHEAAPESLREEVEALKADAPPVTDAARCPWLIIEGDSCSCREYLDRPHACRDDYCPPGGTICEDMRRRKGETPYDGPEVRNG